MREILFRAKRIDNGEWVEGSLIQAPYLGSVRSWISSEQDDKSRLRAISTYQAEWRAFEVRTETLCQYTGMTDKNGQKIWENDILVAHLDENYPEDETYEQVIWHESGFCTMENGSDDMEPLDGFDTRYFAVCGNIFDNAELLERKE